MKFDEETILHENIEIMDIHGKDLSYSPLFSNIGLSADEDSCGIDALYLNYNRTCRAVWAPFITFEEGMVRTPSSVCGLSFQKENKKADIAFYDKDCLMVETEGLDSFVICEKLAETSADVWVESGSETCVILRGYSENMDARDPDKWVPYMAGVKVVKGCIEEANGKITVKADGEGKILAAFAIEILVISEENIYAKLEQAPKSVIAAEKMTEEWFKDCLSGYVTEVESEKEKRILTRAITGFLFNETKAPGNLNGYISAYPSRGTYPTHFLWDSCFQNLALEECNVRLAKDALLLFAKCQRADGKYPQFLCATWDRPHEAQPALIGWATMRIVEKAQDEDRQFEETMLSSLEKNNRWWLSQRMTRYGVIYCPHGLETGQDDSPRFDNGPVLAVDMNSYLLSQMRATQKLADKLGKEETAAAWCQKADTLARNMIHVFYDPKENMFFDADPVTGKRASLWTSSGFLPLWAGIGLDEEKIVQMIETHMLDKNRFFGKIPFPCVAYDQDVYQPEKWWRGPTWLSLAWLMVETLEKYGFTQAYEHVCRVYYEMILNDGQIRELFNSQTGEGLGAYDQGWTAAVLIKLNRILYSRGLALTDRRDGCML